MGCKNDTPALSPFPSSPVPRTVRRPLPPPPPPPSLSPLPTPALIDADEEGANEVEDAAAGTAVRKDGGDDKLAVAAVVAASVTSTLRCGDGDGDPVRRRRTVGATNFCSPMPLLGLPLPPATVPAPLLAAAVATAEEFIGDLSRGLGCCCVL